MVTTVLFLNFLTLFCNKLIAPRHPQQRAYKLSALFFLYMQTQNNKEPGSPIPFITIPLLSITELFLPTHKITLCGLTRKAKEKHFQLQQWIKNNSALDYIFLTSFPQSLRFCSIEVLLVKPLHNHIHKIRHLSQLRRNAPSLNAIYPVVHFTMTCRC